MIKNYYCSGKRAEDIALKKKYDNVPVTKIKIQENIYETIKKVIETPVEIVYILPTYTAIFETRDYVEKIVKEA